MIGYHSCVPVPSLCRRTSAAEREIEHVTEHHARQSGLAQRDCAANRRIVRLQTCALPRYHDHASTSWRGSAPRDHSPAGRGDQSHRRRHRATPARPENDGPNSIAPRTPSHLLPFKPSAMLAARMVSHRANGPLTGTVGPIFDTAGDSSRCGCRGVHPIGWRRSTARPALYGIANTTEICSPLLIAIYLASPNTLDARTIVTGQFNYGRH